MVSIVVCRCWDGCLKVGVIRKLELWIVSCWYCTIYHSTWAGTATISGICSENNWSSEFVYVNAINSRCLILQMQDWAEQSLKLQLNSKNASTLSMICFLFIFNAIVRLKIWLSQSNNSHASHLMYVLILVFK